MQIRRIILVAALVTLAASSSAQESKSEKGFTPDGIEVDHQAILDFEAVKQANRQFTEPSRRRWTRIADLVMSYRAVGAGEWRVYQSPHYRFAENDNCAIALSPRGGFRIVRDSPMAPYRVVMAMTASEVATEKGWQNFISRSNLMAAGSHANGGYESGLAQTDLVLSLTATQIMSQRPADAGLVWFDYRYTSVYGGTNGIRSDGELLVDPAKDYVVHAHNQSISQGAPRKEVLKRDEKFTYFPATPEFPDQLIRTWEMTETFRKNKPKVRRLALSDYRLEELDPERLRLSYYGLPNELVEDLPDYRGYWVAGVAGLSVVGFVVFTRRWLKGRKL